MFSALKKTIGVCLIGLGLGILLVLLLPISGWLFAIGIAVVAIGLAWLSCKWKSMYKSILGKKGEWRVWQSLWRKFQSV